jgi:DNA-binding transcriptional regulator PaaX
MGKLEKRVRQWKKGDVQKAMLAALGIAGLLTLTAIAPNTLQLLRYVPGNRDRFSRYTQSAARRLVTKGQAEWVEERGKRYLSITEKGKKELAFEQARVALETRKKKRWDGKWRMVVFDIPERRRRTRFRLRAVMQEVGFVRLQDSVWVYPYDCEDFIALLKAELKIGKDVLYAIADTIEYDRAIRSHFGLK